METFHKSLLLVVTRLVYRLTGARDTMENPVLDRGNSKSRPMEINKTRPNTPAMGNRLFVVDVRVVCVIVGVLKCILLWYIACVWVFVRTVESHKVTRGQWRQDRVRGWVLGIRVTREVGFTVKRTSKTNDVGKVEAEGHPWSSRDTRRLALATNASLASYRTDAQCIRNVSIRLVFAGFVDTWSVKKDCVALKVHLWQIYAKLETGGYSYATPRAAVW
jgi:hypothetical protein